MHNKLFLSVLFFILTLSVHSQTFLNGSFETTTAPGGCNYNLLNGGFNGWMANTNAFGAGNELDIISAGCYNPTIPNGIRAVGVAADPTDQFAMALSAPLVAGNNYTFTFRAYSEITFRPQGNVQIGAATNNSSFGTLIYTAVTVPNVWTTYTVNFVAPPGITHISVRNQAGAIYWNHVDHFVMGAPLPIELANFEAKYQQNKVTLDWTTSSEINNEYFTIERSTDAVNFTELERVPGAGNSNTLLDYTSVDPDPYIGTNYYRLRQTDYDGEFKFSEVISVDVEHIDVEVFPNPTPGDIQIRISTKEKADIRITNSLGMVVKEIQLANEYINISELPNGIYFISISTSGETIVKRIIKE